MNICIPIDNDQGLDSRISLHFSGAPKFIIVNTRTLTFDVFDPSGLSAETDAGRCLVLARARGATSVIVGGIGLDALSELQDAGLSVYSSAKDTVREIAAEFSAGQINPITLGNSCKHGGRGFGRGFGGMGCGGAHGCGGH